MYTLLDGRLGSRIVCTSFFILQMNQRTELLMYVEMPILLREQPEIVKGSVDLLRRANPGLPRVAKRDRSDGA